MVVSTALGAAALALAVANEAVRLRTTLREARAAVERERLLGVRPRRDLWTAIVGGYRITLESRTSTPRQVGPVGTKKSPAGPAGHSQLH